VITRIELHNFMSHRKTVIEPSSGLTVLVGPNNVGKSAIVAALQILCHNENSTYVKRHGAKDCAVIVHTDDGHVIEWRRRNSPRYVIDGVEFDRLKNGVPPELHKALRLPLVAEEDDDSFNVHFGSQKSPIFLLNSKAGTAAKFFASSSDAIRLLEMQQRHKEKVTESKRQHKQLEAEAAVLNAELEVLAETVPVADRLAVLESQHEELGTLGQAIVELGRCEAGLVERAFRVDLHSAQSESLRPLRSPPVLDDPAPLERHVAQLIDTRRRVERLTQVMNTTAALRLPPVLADEVALDGLAQTIAERGGRIVRLTSQGETLRDLPSPPQLEDAIALEALGRQLSRIQREAVCSEARARLLSALAPVPVLGQEAELAEWVRRVDEQVRNVDRMQRAATSLATMPSLPVVADETNLESQTLQLDTALARLAEARTVLEGIEHELTAAASELRSAVEGQSCPTCGQPFDAEQLMTMSASAPGGHVHA
jgi:hypothetical protein